MFSIFRKIEKPNPEMEDALKKMEAATDIIEKQLLKIKEPLIIQPIVSNSLPTPSLSMKTQYEQALAEMRLKFLLAATDNIDQWVRGSWINNQQDFNYNNTFSIQMRNYGTADVTYIYVRCREHHLLYETVFKQKENIPDNFCKACLDIQKYIENEEIERGYAQKLHDINNILGEY